MNTRLNTYCYNRIDSMSAQFYNQIGAFEMDDEYVQWSTSCKEIGVGFHFVNR